MKTIKQIFILLTVFLLATGTLNAKDSFRGDTVRIKIDDILIEVISSNLNHETVEKADIPGKTERLLEVIEKVKIVPPASNEKIRIKYTDYPDKARPDFQQLELSTIKSDSKSISINKGTLLEDDPGKIIVEIEDFSYLIRIYCSELEDLKKITTDEYKEKLSNAASNIPANRGFINGWLSQNNDGTFESHFIGEYPKRTLDMLIAYIGVGAGIIKDELVTDINYRIGLSFANKGTRHYQYWAGLQFMYDFPDQNDLDKFQYNTFLNFGWEINSSKHPDIDKWYGVSFGYLIKKDSDFFRKGTMKLGVQRNLNNSITVNPEIYFHGFLKGIYPGIRIQFSF